MNPRRLYRNHDRQLAGVAGGMAEYLDIDPTVVRILWIIVGIASGGLALIAYIVLALVIPQAPGWDPQWSSASRPAVARAAGTRGLGAGAIIGVVLIVFGAIALADVALPGWAFGTILGPAVILALGAALLVSSVRRRDVEASAAPAASAPADILPADPSSQVDPA